MTALHPITDIHQLADLKREAASDNHICICPSYMVIKDEDIVGYASIGAVPLVHWWLHREKGTAMDTVRVLKQGEEIIKSRGYDRYQVLCSDDSPYLPKMGKLGYTGIGKTNLFMKGL